MSTKRSTVPWYPITQARTLELTPTELPLM
ncbi:ORFL246C [Human betaherpesvirus 5]|nr:ORFL246C [Human betaherpesvirus 5]QHX40617.1 ORFL246C [Human betaherpesvirus 5]